MFRRPAARQCAVERFASSTRIARISRTRSSDCRSRAVRVRFTRPRRHAREREATHRHAPVSRRHPRRRGARERLRSHGATRQAPRRPGTTQASTRRGRPAAARVGAARAHRHDGERVDAASSPVVFDPLRGGVWTANGDVGTISYADIDKQAVRARGARRAGHHLGRAQPGLRVARRGRPRRAPRCRSLDATSGQVRRTIALGTHPRAAVWDAWDPRWLYVSLEDDGAIAVVDRTLGVLDHTVPVGRIPAGLAVVAAAPRARGRPPHRWHRVDRAAARGRVFAGGSGRRARRRPARAPAAAEPTTRSRTGRRSRSSRSRGRPTGTSLWVPHELLANHHPVPVPARPLSGGERRRRGRARRGADQPERSARRHRRAQAALRRHQHPRRRPATRPSSRSRAPPRCTRTASSRTSSRARSEDLLTFDLDRGHRDRTCCATCPAITRRASRSTTRGSARSSWRTSRTRCSRSTPRAARSSGTSRSSPGRSRSSRRTRWIRSSARARSSSSARNSSKNPLPMTGNDWMSCGGCHLDGFVSTNAFVLRGAPRRRPDAGRADRARGAEGHVLDGADADDAVVQPARHPVGDARPGRSRARPDGRRPHGPDRSVEPRRPTAVTMAQQIAHVVARDLPAGPSWLVADGGNAEHAVRRLVVRQLPQARVRRVATERARALRAGHDGQVRHGRRAAAARAAVLAAVRGLPRSREPARRATARSPPGAASRASAATT